MFDFGIACEAVIAVGVGRLLAHTALDCGCCLSVDVLTGDRIHLAITCAPHVAACAFADSAE